MNNAPITCAIPLGLGIIGYLLVKDRKTKYILLGTGAAITLAMATKGFAEGGLFTKPTSDTTKFSNLNGEDVQQEAEGRIAYVQDAALKEAEGRKVRFGTDKYTASSIDTVNLPDGTYEGGWTGYELTIRNFGKDVIAKTDVGIRSPFPLPVIVDVIEGFALIRHGSQYM